MVRPLEPRYRIHGQVDLGHILACACHVAQEHVSDPQAWNHSNLETYMTCVDYQVACFLAQNTINGYHGVECGVVMEELCSMPPWSIEQWEEIIDRRAKDYGGWKGPR